MRMIQFIVPGIPHPQGRPRFARMGNFVRTYERKEDTDWKSRVAFFARQAMGNSKPLEGPVHFFMSIYLPRPKALSGKKYPDASIPAPRRPDCSNFLKGAEDALNGICWHDDGQITNLEVTKAYHAKSEGPGTVFYVSGELET